MRPALLLRLLHVAVVAPLSLLPACGGGTPPAKTGAETAQPGGAKGDGVVRPITQGQLKVAHYASRDGTVGLVLDRTGEHPKVRVDGTKDVVELTMVEDRYAGELRGHYLKSPTGSNVVYLGANGDISYFTARDKIAMNSDNPADPLPAPTVAGQYHPDKSSYQRVVEAVTPLGVRTKLPQLAPEDSANLDKVGEVMEAIDASLFVRVTAAGAERARWAPASAHIGNVHQGLGGAIGPSKSDLPWDKTKPGLKKHGGVLFDDHPEFDRPSRLRMHALVGWPPPLAPETPGIVWEVDDGTVVFVSLDGGRYEIMISELTDKALPVTPGLLPPGSWPPPLQHTLLDVDSIRALAKGGAIPKETGPAIEAIDDGWFTCVNALWAQTKKDLDKIEASSASTNEKWGRLLGARKSAELNAPKKCAPQVAKLDQAITKFIEARNAERLAMYDLVKPAAAKAITK